MSFLLDLEASRASRHFNSNPSTSSASLSLASEADAEQEQPYQRESPAVRVPASRPTVAIVLPDYFRPVETKSRCFVEGCQRKEVEKRPALYKKRLKEYSDINQKKKLWEEVYEAVVPEWNQLNAEDKIRMGKASVESVLNEITPFIKVKSRRNNGIPPLHQLLLALRFYALGTMLNSVADFAGVSLSSACRKVADISAAIARLYNKYIFLHPRTTDKFYNISQFPRVCGAIDCTHVRIQSPCSTIGEEYRNRKGYFSINVQAVCDADLKLLNVAARWPGSAHDATIFNNSVSRAQCEDGIIKNHWLLGNSVYPNRSYLLTPLLSISTSQEIRYNESHIKTRNTIERTFGVWKRHFPVISLTMRLSLYNIQAVIIATAVLHNICRNYNIEEVPPEVETPEESEITVTSRTRTVFKMISDIDKT
ncbi:unnamed protein product [Euphydryas editha]|uniref:DDE Tnp4 domain-containing protein n=1 Tax=Euphydryas editha TaxID=104508 RepID=A0AAU9UND7_EUPED|nr:unnamed protein product [Euphydryas editha]